MFPEGAFEACAIDGHLLGAVAPDGSLVGYLAYRMQRRLNHIAIVHLCVGNSHRGKGVSDALFESLKSTAESLMLDGIRLKCRRDYHADPMWKRMGLVARGESPGRGADGTTLTLWVFDFHRPTLFSAVAASTEEPAIKAVLDANVFFDLHPNGGPRNEEALPLLEPWVEHEVDLCVVDEIHNEIDRCRSAERRKHLHEICHRFNELHCAEGEWRRCLVEIEKILGPCPAKANDEADRRQLAKTVAAGAQVFLTRDTELLAAASEIEAAFGVRVMRPSELLSSLDETERALAYQPARLAGTNLAFKALPADEIDGCLEAFQAVDRGETRAQLAAKVRELVARVRATPAFETTVVRNAEGQPLALVSAGDDPPRSGRRIALFRFARSDLAPTLARGLALPSP
ncbi:MAG: GNAT family N-acetyltransferase [Opitutaceae bacterium]